MTTRLGLTLLLVSSGVVASVKIFESGGPDLADGRDSGVR
jgi:hypothetical protein